MIQDRDLAGYLALIAGSLGKIALDIMIMASTEFGEVYEPFLNGRGASTTMPQKRNPISTELILAASKAVRQHAGLMLDAMIQDFERATGPWHAEWMALPESFMLTAGALHQAKFALGGPCTPSASAETRVMAPVCRSLTNTSKAPLVSPATRLLAKLKNAT